MKQLMSGVVDDSAARDGIEEFRHAVSDTFVPLAMSVDDGDESFRWRLRSFGIGALQLSEVSVSRGAQVRRTGRLIERAGGDYLKVGVQLRGRCVVSQGDRESELLPGDYAVYDTNLPYELKCAEAYQMLVLMFPRNRLRLSFAQLSDVTALRVSGRHGLGAAVSPFLVELGKGWRSDHAGAHHLADGVLDVLAASLVERFSVTPSPSEPGGGGLLLRACAFIEQRLGDPGLDVMAVAAAHHVSVRHLQKLFEAEGRTVSGWIRDRRIERCRKDLTDTQFAQLGVGSVAARWGLPNAAHFSRLFKAAYGESPTEYRRHVSSRGAVHVPTR